MEILETRVYRGPNIYALWPTIRLKVDLGELESYPTIELPGFAERLLDLIPTLDEHTCGLGVPGAFVERMKEGNGTWLGHVLEHLAIELQCLAGTPVTFGKTRQDGLPRGQYHVVYSYVEESVGLEAGRLALRLIRHLLPPERPAHDASPFDFHFELERLVSLARRRALGPTTAALVRAAEERGIPWLRLDESLVQLGHGRYQRLVRESVAHGTRQIAVLGMPVGLPGGITGDDYSSLAPELHLHLGPAEGTPRDVAGRVLDMLFPGETPRCIPIAVIAGAKGRTVTARLAGHILGSTGCKVGLATVDGISVDGTRTVRGDMTDPVWSRLVLSDPRVEAAVLETACDGILRSGLGLRRCTVGAVLDVETEAAEAERIVVEVAGEHCVLDADDPRVAALAKHGRAEPIYVTRNFRNELVRRHVLEGKKAVVLEEGINGPMLVLYQGEEKIPILSAHQIPSTLDGAAAHNVRNAMFAAAVACGLGVGIEDIREGLHTFVAARKEAPVREEVLEEVSSRTG